MPSVDAAEMDWMAVTARCLAYLCLRHSDVADKGLLARATFLMNLGLPRHEAAALLGSTDDSLRVTLAAAAKGTTTKKRSGNSGREGKSKSGE
jgi:hypothetical protein